MSSFCTFSKVSRYVYPFDFILDVLDYNTSVVRRMETWNFCQDFVDSYTVHVLGSSEGRLKKKGHRIVRDLTNFTVILIHVQWHFKIGFSSCS